MAGRVEIENLAQFRAALRACEDATPRELTKAIRLAGVPLKAEAGALAPRRSGRLAAGYRISASGSRGRIVSAVPYAAGAEFGQRGKWKGFLRYGGVGERFAGRAIETKADEVFAIVTKGLEDIIDLHGWTS